MNLLLQYPRIVFFTGAGMSKESGVPTYRGQGGLWNEYRYQDYACQAAFDANPEAVWDFHDQRRAAVAACQPHSGHHLLSRLSQARQAHNHTQNGGIIIVTQNIDGMHQRAGAGVVHELHGSLWRVRCDTCGVTRQNSDLPLVPRRHHCGNYLRPDIVWFGDALDRAVLTRTVHAITHCNLFVSIGTSSRIFPAARLPLHAIEAGAFCVEINPEPTAVSRQYQKHMRGPASEMIRQLFS